MALSELFVTIESAETDAKANVVSGLSGFLRALASMPEIVRLASLSQDQTIAAKVLDRLLDLTEVRVDLRYENPFDTSLAAYLLTLQSAWPKLGSIGAQAVLTRAQNCWWSTQIALDILTNREFRTRPDFSSVSVAHVGPEGPRTQSVGSDSLVSAASSAASPLLQRVQGGLSCVRESANMETSEFLSIPPYQIHATMEARRSGDMNDTL